MPTHSETRRMPYSAEQMYALVADVQSYPKFLPWTSGARIRSRHEEDGAEVLLADLIISFKVFRESFGSRVVLREEERVIETSYIDGPFEHMESRWAFRDVEGGCEVTFDVDFEFKSRLLRGAANMFFQDAMERVVGAFERRAHELHG